jgi:hypothetical protein
VCAPPRASGRVALNSEKQDAERPGKPSAGRRRVVAPVPRGSSRRRPEPDFSGGPVRVPFAAGVPASQAEEEVSSDVPSVRPCAEDAVPSNPDASRAGLARASKRRPNAVASCRDPRFSNREKYATTVVNETCGGNWAREIAVRQYDSEVHNNMARHVVTMLRDAVQYDRGEDQ